MPVNKLSVAAAEAETVIGKTKDYDNCNNNPYPSITAAVCVVTSAAAAEIACCYVGHIWHLHLSVVTATVSRSPEQKKEKNDEPEYRVVSVTTTVKISS